MNDQLRAAAQAILDRWDSPKWEWATQGPTADLMAELRAALAQQAERFCDTHCTWADHAPGCVRAEPVQEPVAWMYTGIKQDGTEHGPHLVWKPEYMDAMSASKGAKATPLYTAPPQRKPLTEEEIGRVWPDNGAGAWDRRQR